MTAVRNGGIESQNRAPFGVSLAVEDALVLETEVVLPSHVIDARRSVVTPPKTMNLSRRTLAVNSTPL